MDDVNPGQLTAVPSSKKTSKKPSKPEFPSAHEVVRMIQVNHKQTVGVVKSSQGKVFFTDSSS